MTRPCDCGATTFGRWADIHTTFGRWADIHSPTCSTFGATVAERHAALRHMEYRAIDAQAGAIDLRAIRHFRLWLEQKQRWYHLTDLDRRSLVQQTELARQWEDQIDEGQYRQEQALGGPVHDREMYSASATKRNLE